MLTGSPGTRRLSSSATGSRRQVRIAVKKIFDDNPELADEIKTKITEQLKEKAK
jgi:hypothetical protein